MTSGMTSGFVVSVGYLRGLGSPTERQYSAQAGIWPHVPPRGYLWIRLSRSGESIEDSVKTLGVKVYSPAALWNGFREIVTFGGTVGVVTLERCLGLFNRGRDAGSDKQEDPTT